jgi:hypothetical protein
MRSVYSSYLGSAVRRRGQHLLDVRLECGGQDEGRIGLVQECEDREDGDLVIRQFPANACGYIHLSAVDEPVMPESLEEHNVPLGQVCDHDFGIGAPFGESSEIAIRIADRSDGTDMIAVVAN